MGRRSRRGTTRSDPPNSQLRGPMGQRSLPGVSRPRPPPVHASLSSPLRERTRRIAVVMVPDPLAKPPRHKAKSPIGPLTIRVNSELHMIDRQGIPPGDVPAIFRYHAEQCAAAIGGIALIAGIWAFSWPSSTSSTHGDFARFGPLLLIPAFGIAMLLTMRNRKPARLAMWEAGVRLCMECGHDMAPDSMHRCPACTWLDAQRAPELDGRVSPNLSSPGRFRTALKVGPLTLLLLPELKEARLRELAPKVLYGRSPHYLAELLCVPCLMVIVAGIAGFVALASAPAGTPSALAILLRSSLPVVLLSVLAFWNLRYCRRMLRSARRLAGQRLCRKCGYEMTMLGSFQCPECGWIDRLRAPRDEKPAEST